MTVLCFIRVAVLGVLDMFIKIGEPFSIHALMHTINGIFYMFMAIIIKEHTYITHYRSNLRKFAKD